MLEDPRRHGAALDHRDDASGAAAEAVEQLEREDPTQERLPVEAPARYFRKISRRR